jgi:hypothetical protein
MKTLIAGGALLLLLAGCSATPAPIATFGLGDQAVSIAQAVRACRATSEQPVPAGATGIASVATCSINGSQVDFVVWTDLAAQKAQGPVATATTETYVAHGSGWDAVTHDSGQVGTQKVIAAAIVSFVGGTGVHVRG